jgi:hypothetical protein
MTWLRPVDHVRYVDPQRRYTVVLGPSWNAPIGALPHDDRAGTHDSADGQCGSYASVGHGQAATNIYRRYPQRVGIPPLLGLVKLRSRLRSAKNKPGNLRAASVPRTDGHREARLSCGRPKAAINPRFASDRRAA